MLGTIPTGEVTRHIGSRGAFEVSETITLNDGRSFPKKYTIWYEGEPPAVGSIVAVSGEVTVKLREYAAPSGMKTATDINFNEPTITVHGVAPKTEELPF
jgi:hypothetical protein